MSACECSLCKRKFTGLTTFDKHQDVNHGRRPAVICLDPASIGMRQDKRGRWGFPLDASSRPGHWILRAERATGGVSG